MNKLFFCVSKFSLALLIIIAATSCKNFNFDVDEAESSNVYQQATPIQLDFESTTVFLGDYVKDISTIDSIQLPKGLSYQLIDGFNKIELKANNNIPDLSSLKIFDNETVYSILLRKSRKMEYVLKFYPKDEKVDKVQVMGSMNGWNASAGNFINQDSVWIHKMVLPAGKYQYKILVNGVFANDPLNPEQFDDNFGGYNNEFSLGSLNTIDLPKLVVSNHSVGTVLLKVSGKPDKVIAYWNNYELPKQFIKQINKSQLEIIIPNNAFHKDKSYIRVWSYNQYGASNDLLIPIQKGSVINSSDMLTRKDKHAMTLYFLMVDRFKNGNPDNDKKVDDPEILPKANYFGGDLAGISSAIMDGYFKDLGINTIWVSPITQNPLGAWGLFPDPKTKFSGYHGYWPISNKNVDFRFGTNNEFKELINLSHNNNLNVVLDYVANHVHIEHPVYQQHKDWATNLYLPDGSLNTEKWDEYRLTTWFDTFLPTLDLENPEVIDAMTDSALVWVKDYKLDGFRHDATKHVSEAFWRTLTKKIKNITKDTSSFYQIGETYGNRELIGSYINTGEMDAQFDFNVYDDAISTFGKDETSMTRLAESLQESLNFYGYHNLMGYISGNQDKPRFISLAGGDVDWSENQKRAGWVREIGVGDPIGYKRLMQLQAFNFTIPGVPVIYYGDEFGMPGANDPDNRRMMRFENLSEEETNVLEVVKKLVKIRSTNLALIYGDYRFINANETTYVYARKFLSNEVIVIFNKSKEMQTIEFDVPDGYTANGFKSSFSSEALKLKANKLSAKVAPNSFEIFIK